MSEDERRKRLGYRETRKKRITLLSVLLISVLTLTLIFAILGSVLNKTYYVSYMEKSSVDYGVYLKENDFYNESFLGKDYAYIATLIDQVEAAFNYNLSMKEISGVDFEYSYRIDSIVQIKDKYSGKILYAPSFNELEQTTDRANGSGVNIKEVTKVKYDTYDSIARDFIKAYNLKNVDANLIMKMTVNVVGESEAFHENENKNSHVSSISIPLAADTVEIKITSAVPKEEQKILSYTTEKVASAFKTVAAVFACFTAIIGAMLWVYAFVSRNVDITYDIKVAKILRSYKSFIQKIKNAFSTEGYQLLLVSSFDEMLDIRDTIQSPILMEENGDRTRTRFFIPTNTKLLYYFEIKVDDYDEIYANEENKESLVYIPAEDIAIEVNVEADCTAYATEVEPLAAGVNELVEEKTDGEVCEPVEPESHEEEAVVLVPEGIIIIEPEEPVSDDGDNDNTSLECLDAEGRRIKIACNRSFSANLIQSNPQVKSYYSEIKNKILSYKKVKARTSWRYESFKNGRRQLFKLKIRGKTICLYCALNPMEFDRTKYFHEEALAKTYADVPMLVRVRSNRGLRRALGLIELVMEKYGLSPLSAVDVHDYTAEYPYETTEQLVSRGLIKLLYPGAVAAEPKPHHIHKKTVTVSHDDVVEEVTIFDEEVATEEILEAVETPIVALEEIDYDEDSEPTDDVAEEGEEGVDVIGVVWPERPRRNKIYRYDPDGESVLVGDTVIVPTRDVSKGRDVVRRAVVAHSNHKIHAESIKHPLKKILGIIRQKSE